MHGFSMPASPFSPSAASAWLLVLLCATTGTYCLLRLRRAGREARGAVAGEAVMGFGMAVMAAPTGIGPWGPRILLAVFCAAAVHAVWLLRAGVRHAHHVHHAIGAMAMAYMAYLGLSMTAGHAHGPAAGLPLVTGALLVYFAGYVLLSGARLVVAGPGPGAGAGPLPAAGGGPSELTRACRLTMGMGMLAMLLGM